MLDLNNAYSFCPTVAMVQDGDQVIIGSDISNCVALHMSTVSGPLRNALNELAKGELLCRLLENLDQPDKSSFLSVLGRLEAGGYIEPVEAKLKAIKSSAQSGIDYERFDRQINLFRHRLGSYERALEVQHALDNSKITLIGLGGCGSYIFYTLAAMGIGTLRCIEFDTVQRSNLSRQILYTYDDIGRKKVDVASERGSKISPTTKFEFLDLRIEDVASAKPAFEDVDLVICAADIPRPEFFLLANRASYTYGIPLLYARSVTTNAILGPLVIPGKTRCYRCINNMPEISREDRHAFVNTATDAYMTTLIDPYNAVGGSLAALEAVKFLTDFDECQVVGKRRIMSFSDYQLMPEVPVHGGLCDICN